MIMNEKDKLDILIYNICNDSCSKQSKIEKLSVNYIEKNSRIMYNYITKIEWFGTIIR